MSPAPETARGEWTGPTRPFDLVKEVTVLTVVALVVVSAFSFLFSSPDQKSVTIKDWATQSPADFITTASAELGGTSDSATYGYPYNKAADGQKLGPLPSQRWGGTSVVVDSAQDFVISPLETVSASDPELRQALAQYTAAAATEQQTWTTAVSDALTATPDSTAVPADPAYGPASVLVNRLLSVAQSGTLDGLLQGATTSARTNTTKQLVFLTDSGYFADLGASHGLSGDNWGVMNGDGNWPGQTWLWMFALWYHVWPANTSGNGDVIAVGLTLVVTLGVGAIPYVPGLRRLPKYLGVHKLIWRKYYRDAPVAPVVPKP